MTSAEKILAGIIDSAKIGAEEIIATAQKEAETVKLGAEAKAEKEAKAIIASAEEKAELIKETGKSGAALILRDASLSCRREQIDALIEKTVEKIINMPDIEYFDFLYGIIVKNSLNNGILMLSDKDLKRDVSILKTMLSSTNIEISETPMNAKGGFVLKQGDIEINATLEALVHEKRGALVDEINNILMKG